MKKLLVLIGFIFAFSSKVEAQGIPVQYSGTLQWTYTNSTNYYFKIYAALGGASNYSVIGTVTNKTQSVVINLPVETNNYFYVTAVDIKTLKEGPVGNIVTNKFTLSVPLPVTNLVLTNIVLQ